MNKEATPKRIPTTPKKITVKKVTPVKVKRPQTITVTNVKTADDAHTITAGMLDEAYNELLKLKAELLQAVFEAKETAAEARMIARDTQKKLKPLLDKHNDEIVEEALAESRLKIRRAFRPFSRRR